MEQLRLIRQHRWPHYRAGHRGEKLVGPFALGFDEQLELAADLLGSPAAAASRGHGAADEPRGASLEGRAAGLHLVKYHGLQKDDVEMVRELGRAAARRSAGPDADSSDEEAHGNF